MTSPLPHLRAGRLLLLVLLLVPSVASALTVLGTGPNALIGGDLTDPENDGSDATGSGFNWVSIIASSENAFAAEGAFNIFDNQVGSGDAKWCCEGAPQWIAVELDQPHVLTHFTIAAGNDAPSRDPTRWMIEGSDDGSNWTPIFGWDAGISPFSQRLEVIRFDGNGADFAIPPPYRWLRYHALTTDDALHQVNEVEFFGTAVTVFNDFSVDKPLIPPGEPVTLSWDLDPSVTGVAIDNGVGDVTGSTLDGSGQMTIDPGPAVTTTYTMTAVHPETTAQQSVTVTVTDQPVINSFTADPPVIAPGGSATLQWTVFNTVALDLNGTDVTGLTSLAVSPAGGATYTLTATNPAGTSIASLGLPVVIPGQPVISEFMAANDGAVIVDEDGDSSDWVEIHNPSGETAFLDGYYLTDDAADRQKWRFPAVELAALDYLVVFASGKDRAVAGSELHASFALSANGEYLALVAPDGTTIVSEFGLGGTDYPAQEAGVSFGVFGDPPQPGYFDQPTPGGSNSGGFLGFVADTKFAPNRGFFDAPQLVEITSATPGATIRYTTDGTWPSESRGTIYNGPVAITRTTPLRAIAYKAGHRPTNIDCHTYVFVDDVVTQDGSNTQTTWGLPPSWDGISPDYGLNAGVVSLHNATIRNDLQTVPSLSIVMDNEDLFGVNGIYSHPENSGVAWERAASIELIDPASPDGSNDFQLNCGIRIQGGAFRSFGLTRKKAFRLLFKGIYGPTKLRYPMFGPAAARQFDTLTLRMESNDGYQWENRTNVQYARDEFTRRTQLDMGNPASHGRYLHLYINGVYWGLYNAVERPDVSFGESYFGARKDEWDSINTGTPTNDSKTDSWNTLRGIVDGISTAPGEAARTALYMEAQGLQPDGTNDAAKADFIDIDNYIDYLLVNFYIGNADWPQRNYYHGRERDLLDPALCAGSRTSEGTFFFCWDGETSMFLNSVNDRTGVSILVAEPFSHLRQSEEFRVRFGDRAHRALFNGGTLTPQKCLDRYDGVTSNHQSILIPELARWGDQNGVQRTLQQWINEYNHIRDDWLAVRAPALVTILQGANLYPDLAAPVFSQHGGGVAPDTPVTMSSDADTIYYTLDGSDPRALGGGIASGALPAPLGEPGPGSATFIDTGHTWKYLDDGTDQGTNWRDPGFADASWSSGPSQLGYGSDGEGSGTTVAYGPDPNNKYVTTYFRTTVEIPDPGAYDHFLLRVKYDDAVGVYLNGTPMVLTPNMPNGAGSAFDEYATALVADENAWYDYILPASAFEAGVNTLAAEVHQFTATSSDMRFDAVLRGEVGPSGGANQSDPLFFSENTFLAARSYDSTSGEWSALNQALFTVDVITPDGSSLVVSEFNYRPYDPVLPGELAISANRDDYEYVELLNTGPSSLDLGEVRFDDGIFFTFPEFTFLAPGARILVVANLAAFTARYGAAPGPAAIAGEYSGNLSNDGERILITGPFGTLRDFIYNDQLPWPTAADGDGPSLVLIDPISLPDHNVGSNWRASTNSGGAPGTGDSLSFADWKAARGIIDDTGDPDDDGLNNFGEFAMGTEFDDPSSNRSPSIYLLPDALGVHLGFDVRISLAAMEEAELSIESSPRLVDWLDATDGFTVAGQFYHGDGTVTVSFRSVLPVPAFGEEFFRAAFWMR